MIATILGALLLAEAGAAPDPVAARPMRFAQVVIQEQITVRMRSRGRGPPPPKIDWKEKRGPKCIPANAIAGAALIGPNSVDIILRDNRRIRARLESSCPALDFYRGFYLKPNPDGQICADRDAIRSRMGGQCGIEKFRLLEPVPRD